ncbi:MAG: hypothetical protein ABL966_05205 [Acidimicrobiales bacterium]
MAEVRASIRRHWPVALIILLLVPVVMGIYLAGREVVRPPARYTISADILIPARSEAGAEPLNVPPVLLQGQTDLALAPATQNGAVEEAGLDPTEDNDLRLDARLSGTQTVMTLQVSAPTAQLAADVLEGYITAYEDGRRESVRDAALDLQEIQRRTIRVLERRIDDVDAALTRQGIPLVDTVPDTDPVPVPATASSDDILLAYERNALLNERQRRQSDYALQATEVEIPGKFSVVVQRRATSRVTPPPPSPVVPLLQILGLGLVLALAVPVVIDRLDSTVTEARAAPGAFRTGVLGTIPAMPRRRHRRLAPPGSQWDLAFRSLAATSISTDRLPKAIMVTSPAGTTQDYVAANFAAGLAGLGVNVALIGTVPRQDWFMEDRDLDVDEVVVADDAETARVGAGPGPIRPSAPPTFPELLQDAQAGRLVGDFRGRLGRRDREHLYIVPPGEEETELSLDGLPPLIEALSQSGIDIVVIAGPAFVRDPNATIIAWSTRHVLWAIELGQVEKADAALAVERVELAGVEPFGIALLKRHARRA